MLKIACISQNQILLLSCNLNHESPVFGHALLYMYMNRSTCVDIVYAGDIWGNMKKKRIILYFFKKKYLKDVAFLWSVSIYAKLQILKKMWQCNK